MEQICVRCTRQALRSSSLPRQDASSVLVRHFSLSSLRPAGPVDLSQPIGDDSSPKKPQRPEQTSTTPQSAGSSNFRITRTLVNSPVQRSQNPSRGQAPGVIVRRTGGAQGQISSVLARRNGGSQSQPPPGLLVRRTGGPLSGPGGESPRGPRGQPSAGSSRLPQRGARRGPSSNQNSNNRTNNRNKPPGDGPDTIFDEYVDDDDIALTAYEEDLAASEANNGLPTTPIDYSPAEQTLEELRKDWPDTPLSATGLSEAVVQKLRWLARDLPHGYWTPRQIAERFVAGGLVRFEDAKHKAKVMAWVEKIVAEREAKRGGGAEQKDSAGFKDKDHKYAIAKLDEWAELEEFKGFKHKDHKYRMLSYLVQTLQLPRDVVREWVEAKPLASESGNEEMCRLEAAWFRALGSRKEDKEMLVNQLVRGSYPELPTGQRPLIASVQRQLRNNESYSVADSEKLVGRISTLIESLQSQAAQQKEAAVGQ